MRKQKNFLTLLILFLIVLFTISCNKDNTKSKGIGRYAGEWLASEIMMVGDVVDRYDIDKNTKASLIINSDGSITITSSGEVIKDIEQYSDTSYSFIDGKSNYFVLEFESDTRCLHVADAGKEGDYTTVLVKRQTEDLHAIAEENGRNKNDNPLSFLPDYKTDTMGFARQVFMSSEIRPVDKSITEAIDYLVISEPSMSQIRYNIDPTKVLILRLDQVNDKKSDKHIIQIQQYKSIYELSYEQLLNETFLPLIEEKGIEIVNGRGFWNNSSASEFYNVSFILRKKNGKESVIWNKLYMPFELKYELRIEQKSRNRYKTDEEYYKLMEELDNLKEGFYIVYKQTNDSMYGSDYGLEEAWSKYKSDWEYKYVWEKYTNEVYVLTFGDSIRRGDMMADIIGKYIDWTYYNKKPK